MDKQLEQRIRERAYELWIQHGRVLDRSDDYWLQAEREILGEAQSQSRPETTFDQNSNTGSRTLGDVSEDPTGQGIEPQAATIVPSAGELLNSAAGKTRKKRTAISAVTTTDDGSLPPTPRPKRTPR